MSPDITVSVDPGEIQTLKADSRGRVNLGSEYGGEEVTVAVLGRVVGGDEEEERAECPNECGPLLVRPPEEDDGLREIECPECGYVGGSA